MRFDNKYYKILLDDERGVIKPELNLKTIDGEDYSFMPINPDFPFSKGGNSSVFILCDSKGNEINKVIKISNISKTSKNTPEHLRRKYGRFMNEIEALYNVKELGINNHIVNIEKDGMLNIDGKDFPYYIMEKADSDLKEHFLKYGDNYDLQEKIRLCKDIYIGIKTLHEKYYYHRDIKPDNILLFYTNKTEEEGNNQFIWKIGDLGLVKHRDKDYDDIGEKIGPIGWLSPEAMNKLLTEKSGLGLDCNIDDSSDIFQLGKLFWFVFKYNVPIGQIKNSDFNFNYEVPHSYFIFKMISNMLQYSKERRYKLDQIEDDIRLLTLEIGI